MIYIFAYKTWFLSEGETLLTCILGAMLPTDEKTANLIELRLHLQILNISIFLQAKWLNGHHTLCDMLAVKISTLIKCAGFWNTFEPYILSFYWPNSSIILLATPYCLVISDTDLLYTESITKYLYRFSKLCQPSGCKNMLSDPTGPPTYIHLAFRANNYILISFFKFACFANSSYQSVHSH